MPPKQKATPAATMTSSSSRTAALAAQAAQARASSSELPSGPEVQQQTVAREVVSETSAAAPTPTTSVPVPSVPALVAAALAAATPSSSRPIWQEDYVTVVVTPKLTFQLNRRLEWQTIQDITQEELRNAFLSRFPPALCMSFEKFSFKPTLPSTSAITKDTQSLVYKLVSDEVADERILLSILRELEKGYEGIIRRAVAETRSEALQEQLGAQEQAEEARKELEKQTKELRKDNKSLRDQLQSIQKRLFLVEQEKDQLRQEQNKTFERLGQVERAQAKQAKNAQEEKDTVREQMAFLQKTLENAIAEGTLASDKNLAEKVDAAPAAVSTGTQTSRDAAPVPAAAGSTQESPGQRCGADTSTLTEIQAKECRSDAPQLGLELHAPAAPQRWCEMSDSSLETPRNVGAQADFDVQVAPATSPKDDSAVIEVSRRVDGLQQQMGALRGWLLQGSHLFAMGPVSGGAPAS